MKTFLAVLFGMVLWQLILKIIARRYEAMVEKRKKRMVKYQDKDGTTYFDAKEFDITVGEGYDVTHEDGKIKIRRKKDGQEKGEEI